MRVWKSYGRRMTMRSRLFTNVVDRRILANKSYSLLGGMIARNWHLLLH